jgi:hypothetical protein
VRVLTGRKQDGILRSWGTESNLSLDLEEK